MHERERSLVKKYQDKAFAVLGVKVAGDREALGAAGQGHGFPWRTIWDGDSKKNAQAYKVRGTPSLFLIDKRGRVALTYSGATDENVLAKHIDQLLQEFD
jgi:hypothetical protein